jgi:hypothetical protein
MEGSKLDLQVDFLCECLELLEGDLCKRIPDGPAFYGQMLRALRENNEVLSTELEDLHRKSGSPRLKGGKTYRLWMDRFIEAIESHSGRLSSVAANHGLSRMPRLVKSEGGGAGNPTRYHVDVADNYDEILVEATDPACQNPDKEYVSYTMVKLATPPWYIHRAANFITTGRRRTLFFLSILISAALYLYGLYAFYDIYPTNPYWSIAYVLAMILMLLLVTPFMTLFALMSSKVSLMTGFLDPDSTICISDIVAAPADEGLKSKPIRQLVVATVYADCSICSQRYNLRSSVHLTETFRFPTKIIGICYNNPTMHRYSFDKDTMLGVKL